MFVCLRDYISKACYARLGATRFFLFSYTQVLLGDVQGTLGLCKWGALTLCANLYLIELAKIRICFLRNFFHKSIGIACSNIT